MPSPPVRRLVLAVFLVVVVQGCGVKPFVVANAGLSRAGFAEGQTFSGSTDSNAASYQIGAGFDFLRYGAFEATYVDFGQAEFNGTLAGSNGSQTGTATSGTIDSTGYKAAVMGQVPLGRWVSLLGKVGAYGFNVDRHEIVGTTMSSGDATGVEQLWGAGVRINATRRIGVRVEWERFTNMGDALDTGEGDTDLYSVGVVFRFSKR